jgi:hypothetical protein
MRLGPGVPAVSDQHGGSTGAPAPLADELDAARADYDAKRRQAAKRWEDYQRYATASYRAAWQEAEFDAHQAGKRYGAALAAYEARQGQRSG